MCDLSIKISNSYFNCRVAVIPFNSKKILLQKASQDRYFSLIGGRVKINESSKEAIIREIKEELGLDIDSSLLTLYKVCENFFNYKDKSIHEILFIYKYNLEDNVEMWIKDKENVELKWINLNKINEYDIKPDFVKEIKDLQGLNHVIIKS